MATILLSKCQMLETLSPHFCGFSLFVPSPHGATGQELTITGGGRRLPGSLGLRHQEPEFQEVLVSGTRSPSLISHLCCAASDKLLNISVPLFFLSFLWGRGGYLQR